MAPNTFTNYIAYVEGNSSGPTRIGHLDLEKSTIQPLSFISGAPLSTLYEVIEIGESNIKASGAATFPLASVKLLAPISGRDILAVGKNYAEHAKEFNSSGYDSSDKVDQPTHPVIFTKRATSIIASGEPIYAHEGFTQSPDYEGEIGVIIGKAGFRIEESYAWDHVWGYTIINDMTARERQRDHKQFFIGKSPDTYCPMGPIAVPAIALPKTLRIQTHVNGEEKQNATIDDLIFSVPFLIKTLSEGQTLRPGDVIATGTPAGVGIGKKPPVFLKSGDVVEVSVTGLGVLKNELAATSSENYTVARVSSETCIPTYNLSKTSGGFGLTALNGKNLFYRSTGNPSGPPIIFIHGLGGTSEYYTALTSVLELEKTHSLHFLDLEGHGLSPTSAASTVSISSYESDIAALATHANIPTATVIAHSMGSYIGLALAQSHPDLVRKLILLAPPPSPLPVAFQTGALAQAASVRQQGMASIVDGAVSTGIPLASQTKNPLGVAALRISLLGQDPEGYAKGCMALAASSEPLEMGDIVAETLIVAGGLDVVSPLAVCEDLASQIKGAEVSVMVVEGVGHWLVFEDVVGVAKVVGSFL